MRLVETVVHGSALHCAVLWAGQRPHLGSYHLPVRASPAPPPPPMHLYICTPLHSHLLIHMFICFLLCLFTYLLSHLTIHSLIHSLIYRFTTSIIHSLLIHLFTCSSVLHFFTHSPATAVATENWSLQGRHRRCRTDIGLLGKNRPARAVHPMSAQKP